MIRTRTWGMDDEVTIEFAVVDEAGTGRVHEICRVYRTRDVFATHKAGEPVMKTEINWSAWGSQSVADTKLFAAVLAEAAELARMLDSGLLTAEAVKAHYADNR
jgi:hypothetical protein